MTEKNLTELRDIAKELGIKGVTKYKKEELLNLIIPLRNFRNLRKKLTMAR